MSLPTIDIRIAVVAHMKRIDHAAALAKQVDANYMTVDDGSLGGTNNHRLAWQWHTTQKSHWAVTLEEDAIPVNDFRQQLELALLASPAPIVSLYLGHSRPHEFQKQIGQAITTAAQTGAHFITAADCIHAVGIAIQTKHTPSLVNHLTTPYWTPQPIDNAISTWARQNHHPVAYTYPSLCDHNDLIPVVARGGQAMQPGRIAWTVGTHDQWNSDHINMDL